MFFLISKTLGILVFPSTWIVLLLIAGFLLLGRRARLGRRVMLAGVVVLFVSAVLPTGKLLLLLLEQRFPNFEGNLSPTGIIILGGAIDPELSAAIGSPGLNEAAERITSVAALARRFPDARILYTGGNASLLGQTLGEADFAVGLLESFGIAKQRIEVENGSRNTAENATILQRILKPKEGETWLLVTSAFHMPRAVGCFRRVGFQVIPFPVDRRVGTVTIAVWPSPEPSVNLAFSDLAIHEWVGMFAYWISGRTSTLFPGPSYSEGEQSFRTNAIR